MRRSPPSEDKTVPALLVAIALWAVIAGAWAQAPAQPAASAVADDDPKAFVAFGQDFAALCVGRQGVEITVRNTHPSRTLRAWFDRYHMGTGTGDRSRAELAPHGEPEPLGCSKTDYGPQEWRLVRAQFID